MGKDAHLLQYVSQRILDLSKQPFIRRGAVDLDNGYLVSVFDARTRVGLAEKIIANPGKKVNFGNMGYVPGAEGLYTIWTRNYG